jgi:tetratricopeptide (TPR) repeat protein
MSIESPYSPETVTQEFANAVREHQSGRLVAAAQRYQSILARLPGHSDARHLLGVVALQQGRLQQAVELIDQAIAVNPTVADYHSNLAEANRLLGRFDKAVASGQTALRLRPDFAAAANNLGLALQAQGKHLAAAQLFRKALTFQPDAAMFENNLGNALRLLGDRAGALAHFRQALRLDPHLVEAHTNLGQFLLELHHPQEALDHCREAVRLRPNCPETHNNLGNVLRELGQVGEAKACYGAALQLNSNLAVTCSNLGQAVQEEGDLDQAIAWYQKGLLLEPDSARVHCNLASCLAELEKYEEARTHCERALVLDRDYAEAHSALGCILRDLGQFEKAEQSYREAIRLKPDLKSAHCQLGTVLEERGDLDAALACYRAVLRHDPRHAGAYARMATMLRGKLPDVDLASMRQLLAAPDLSEDKRAPLHFGLAQVLDSHGDYNEVADHLHQANALCRAGGQRRGKSYDPVGHTQLVDAIIATFTPEFFARVRGCGLQTERPVFIVGLPRSGTTLTEQILDSHSQVFGAGELPYIRETFEKLAADTNHTAAPLDFLPLLDRAACERIARHHLDRLCDLNDLAKHIADKMPDNYLYLGLIATLFPRAKLIHCRRDLRDVAVSCWMTQFRQITWASDIDHIASRFREYRRLMDHWRRVLPVPLLEIDYEHTVADLEGVARRLSAWCGLDWEPACLSFHQNRRPVRTASMTQVRQPIYHQSVARWKNYQSGLAPLFAAIVECDSETRTC